MLGSFWASGYAAAHGQNPYATWPLTSEWHPYLGQSFTLTERNLSPPALLPFFALLSRRPATSLVLPWMLVSALLYIATAALLLWYRPLQLRQIVWLLLGEAAVNTLYVGQDYAALAFAAAAGCVFLGRHRDLAAGLAVGFLAAAKPNCALWIVLLIGARRWRPAITAAVTAAVLSAAPLLVSGPRIYAEWREAARFDQHSALPLDMSFVAFFGRLGHPHIGYAVSIAVGVAVVLYAAVRGAKGTQTAGIALCAVLLCSPLAKFHYAILLAGPAVSRPWSWRLTLALVPPFLPAQLAWTAWNHGWGFAVGCICCLPVCALLAHCVARDQGVVTRRRDVNAQKIEIARPEIAGGLGHGVALPLVTNASLERERG